MTTIKAAMARLSQQLPCRGSNDQCHPTRRGRRKSSDQSDYEATSMHTAVIDVAERKEIARILPYLEDGELVLVVARQSRLLPGATLVFTPNVVFCTARRIVIRNPMMLGLREHIDYYRHRDVKSVRLVRGRFTSSLMLTVPGMGTAARSASGEGDGVISAIPHAKAEAIYRIIQEGGGSAGDGRTGGLDSRRYGGGAGSGAAGAAAEGGRSSAVGEERRMAAAASAGVQTAGGGGYL